MYERKKIIQRQNLIKALCSEHYGPDSMSYHHGLKIHNALYENTSGLLAKHDYGAITGGCPVKTNTKKAKASHRHMGGYGITNNYKRRDKQQITYMTLELKQYNTNVETNYDY